jgi:hypothetical protein
LPEEIPVLMILSVDSIAHHGRKERNAHKLQSVLTATFLSFMCCVCNTALAAPEVGWWWNSAESGRGYFIESQGGIMYMAAYLYADDGRARWLVAGGTSADAYHYKGRLLEYSRGQTVFGPYVAPTTPVDAGPVAVDFIDDTHGTISWPGGVVPIEREIFGSGPATYLPESGWWWNPAEGGSGYSIEVQGNNLFFVGFMYDGSGNPVWYYSAGPMTGATTYSGSLLQFANGQTLTGAYHPPSAPATVGSLAVSFTAEDAATLTFTGNVRVASGPSPNAAASRSINMPRVPPVDASVRRADRLRRLVRADPRDPRHIFDRVGERDRGCDRHGAEVERVLAASIFAAHAWPTDTVRAEWWQRRRRREVLLQLTRGVLLRQRVEELRIPRPAEQPSGKRQRAVHDPDRDGGRRLAGFRAHQLHVSPGPL